MQLGDEKPSHLLWKMKILSEAQLKDDFLQNLLMQRIPAHMQTVVSVSSKKPDQLAIITDKVAECLVLSVLILELERLWTQLTKLQPQLGEWMNSHVKLLNFHKN